MKSFTAHLKIEHDLIGDALQALDAMSSELEQKLKVPIADLRLMVYILQNLVETCHHTKEERFLFPALAKSERLRAGGPKCTQYMGQLITHDLAAQILRENSDLAGRPVDAFRRTLTETGSPLRIPMEEHDAGHLCLLRVRLEVEGYATAPENAYRLATRIRQYLRLMRLHIEKENECLFMLVDQLIDESEQRVMLQQALEFERTLGIEKLQEQKRAIAQLKMLHCTTAA